MANAVIHATVAVEFAILAVAVVVAVTAGGSDGAAVACLVVVAALCVGVASDARRIDVAGVSFGVMLVEVFEFVVVDVCTDPAAVVVGGVLFAIVAFLRFAAVVVTSFCVAALINDCFGLIVVVV